MKILIGIGFCLFVLSLAIALIGDDAYLVPEGDEKMQSY